MTDDASIQASDVASTTLLVQAIINLSYESGDYPYVLENLQLLAKKHGQFKTSTTAMVDLVIDWLGAIKASQGDEVWLKWISALRTVTEGKVRYSMAPIRDLRSLKAIKDLP